MNEMRRQELLMGFAEGNLHAEDREAAENLIRTDPAFRREAEELAAAFAILGQEELPAVPHRYFVDLLPRIHHRIEQRTSRRRFMMPAFFPAVLRPAAAVAIVVAMVSLYHTMTPSSGFKEALSSGEFTRQEAVSAANDLSLLSSTAEPVAVSAMLPGMMVIDPNNYQNENDLLAVLDESDAQKVTDRLQQNIRSTEERP